MVTSTAEEALAFESNQIKQTAVNILVPDRALEARLELTWREEGSRSTQLQSAETESGPPRLPLQIRLTLIFPRSGLATPSNATATMVLLAPALSVAGCAFLILELDTPFSGPM